jgi:hypothetical protein
MHPEDFLAFDEFSIEELNQDVAFFWVQRVLPKFHYRTASAPWR